jgi:hypothetical protein
MPITLGTISLPEDLQWTDEFSWSPVAQQREVTFNGALIIEEAAQLAGRPITLEGRLEGNAGFAAVERSVIQDLRALAAEPLSDPLVLTLDDGRAFDVRFNYESGNPVEAKPYKHVIPPANTDLYALTLRLLEV